MQIIADLHKKKHSLHLIQEREVEYSVSLFSDINKASCLYVVSAALPRPPEVENTRGVKEPCSISSTHCS